jgi:putative peptidoglycan lipid II flippase
LFNSPMNIIGPAAGAASLPFFASLWVKNKSDFSNAVNRGVSRLLGVSLLLTSAMISLASPIVDVALRGGRFHGNDASAVVSLFVLFSLSLIFWASQNLYSRAFYAVGDTLTPMISGTIITVISLPVYWFLFHTQGVRGLVIASDIGIAAHMISLAVLLHLRRMVSLAELEWGEITKALVAALCAGSAVTFLLRALPLSDTHAANLLRLAAGSATWLVAALAILFATKSALPQAILRRKNPATPTPATEPAPDAPDR